MYDICDIWQRWVNLGRIHDNQFPRGSIHRIVQIWKVPISIIPYKNGSETMRNLSEKLGLIKLGLWYKLLIGSKTPWDRTADDTFVKPQSRIVRVGVSINSWKLTDKLRKRFDWLYPVCYESPDKHIRKSFAVSGIQKDERFNMFCNTTHASTLQRSSKSASVKKYRSSAWLISEPVVVIWGGWGEVQRGLLTTSYSVNRVKTFLLKMRHFETISFNWQ